MTELLPIGLASWIIQDGNYSDFKVGQEYSFALEFIAREPLAMMSSAQIPKPRHIHKGGAEFAVVGKSIHAGVDWWAVDFGVPAYTSYSAVKSYEGGVFFEGNVYIGVDPFDYFERLARSESAPALIFDWRVERIELQTGPFIKQGERMLVRDPDKVGWRDLQETHAREDNEGRAEYILHCVRLSDQPRHSLTKDQL